MPMPERTIANGAQSLLYADDSEARFALAGSETLGSGIVILTYTAT
jgi:hypothetical protein